MNCLKTRQSGRAGILSSLSWVMHRFCASHLSPFASKTYEPAFDHGEGLAAVLAGTAADLSQRANQVLRGQVGVSHFDARLKTSERTLAPMPANHNPNHSVNVSSTEPAPRHSDRSSISDQGVPSAGAADAHSRHSFTPPGRASESDIAGAEETAVAASESPVGSSVYSHPKAPRESQGSQRVVLADLPVGLALEQRALVALQCAQEAFAQTGYWVAFYKAILGAEGVVNKLFPKVEELDYFYTTEEFAEIQKILTALRASDTEKADAVEPLKMITIRIPRSMQAALISESKRHRTSINKLCITKLLRPIESHWVPEEKGGVKGRKPQA